MGVTFMIGISAIKDAFEDWKRHKSDDEENSLPCKLLPFDTQEFEDAKAEDVKVGMLVKVVDGEFFPCDMYVVNTSNEIGACHVETKNLDGETNLKHK